MSILAGTTRGLFRVTNGTTQQMLNARGVRELNRIGAVIFAGTSNGLFASDDDGASWRPSGLDGLTVWQIRGAADGGVLYAAVEPTGLWRSDDGGVHWNELDAVHRVPGAADWCIPVQPLMAARARALVVDAANPDRLWVGVEVGGIISSIDGGRSFDPVLPGGNPDIHMLFADPVNPDVLYVSTGYGRLDGVAPMIEGNAGVFRSDDGGRHWAYAWKGVTPRYSRPMCIDARADRPLTVACAPTAFSSVKDQGGAEAMLLQSVDGGRSWYSLGDAAHSPSPANFHGLAVHPGAPGDVLTGTDSGEVWHVTSKRQWTRLAAGLPTVLAVHAA
jgi:photosystem II stability/assembly factor-like uncharacterized protein